MIFYDKNKNSSGHLLVLRQPPEVRPYMNQSKIN